MAAVTTILKGALSIAPSNQEGAATHVISIDHTGLQVEAIAHYSRAKTVGPVPLAMPAQDHLPLAPMHRDELQAVLPAIAQQAEIAGDGIRLLMRQQQAQLCLGLAVASLGSQIETRIHAGVDQGAEAIGSSRCGEAEQKHESTTSEVLKGEPPRQTSAKFDCYCSLAILLPGPIHRIIGAQFKIEHSRGLT